VGGGITHLVSFVAYIV